jgi:Integrase core domain
VGDCFENAICESFFTTLECALLNRQSFRTELEARMAVFDFIEGWYNPHRRHSALGYLSPVDYERAYRNHRDQTMKSSTALPAQNIPALTVHGAVVSDPKPITLSALLSK